MQLEVKMLVEMQLSLVYLVHKSGLAPGVVYLDA
jgi:allophanate hydrolase subunit 1